MPLKYVCHCFQNLFMYIEDSVMVNSYISRSNLAYLLFVFFVDYKSGRIPRGFADRRNFWKAEELQKFLFPMSECIFSGLLPDNNYHVIQLLSRITEMVYNFRDGLDEAMLKLFEDLIFRFVLLYLS